MPKILTTLKTSTKACLQRPATKTALRWLAASALILATLYASLILFGRWYDNWMGYGQSSYSADWLCDIAVIRVYGEITGYPEESEYMTTSADEVIARIREAEAASNIYGMLLVVDSPGGYPGASASIAHAIKNSSLWSLAYVRDQALSGGYMIASAADTVMTSPFADIGSIGVTMSYLDQTAYNEREGYRFVDLSSGQYKNAGSPDKQLTAAERALFERDIQAAHETFVDMIAANREIPREDVAALADGSSMNAQLALEKGLVDLVSGDESAKYFAEVLEMNEEDVVFCE